MVECDRVWLGAVGCGHPPEIKIYSKKSGVDPTQNSDYRENELAWAHSV